MEVVLRRLALRDEMPWLSAMVIPERQWQWPAIGYGPDEGWRIHDAGDGAIALESLLVPPSYPQRWLCAGTEEGTASLESKDIPDANSQRWRVHPTSFHTFLLECLGARTARRWLSVDVTRSSRYELTDRPEGRSKRHEFVAFPQALRATIAAQEAAGDFSYMGPHGMLPNGEIPAIPVPPKPKPPLTSADPVRRSQGDPVRAELIAALLPSFEDGDAGPECSMYSEDDPRRIDWPHNVVSLDTVALSSGTICLHREPVEHACEPQELELCRQLAQEVVAALGERTPSGGEPAGDYRPFYLVTGQGEPAPASLTAAVIRAAFHGTLFPDVPIRVEPFLRQPEMIHVGGQLRPKKPRRHPEPDFWQGFREWALAHAALREMAYVEIGYGNSVEPCLAAVFPRLVVGLTRAGSLVGACGFIAQA
jgi:hypothetical protein